jgi:hypothetical protein
MSSLFGSRAKPPASARPHAVSGCVFAFPLALLASACHTSEAAGSGDQDVSAADAAAEELDSAALPFVPVIDQTEWRNYPPELDPLPSHQPDPIHCNIAGWLVERGSLEVDTVNCNYVLVEHPAQIAVREGSELRLELVHFDLDAPEPATAHVALFFGDTLQWEREIPIPSAAYVYKETFQATRSLEPGEPIRFHLHNHGQNTWLLESLYAQVP